MDRTAPLLAAFTLVGTLVGYGIAEAARAPRAAPATYGSLSRTVDPGPGSAATIDQGALVLELRALGDRLEAALSRANDARAPIGAASEVDPDRALALLERCATLIERLERAQGTALPQRLVAPATADRAALPLPPGESDSGRDEWMRDFKSRHLLWSYEGVLDAYGTPDSILRQSNNGAVQWTYSLEDPDGGRRTVYFYFYDGLVGSIGASW